MSDIRAFPTAGSVPTTEPDEGLIENIKSLLSMAESGQLRSFVGVGFMSEGLKVTSWHDTHDDIYQMLGALEWLKIRYVSRHLEA